MCCQLRVEPFDCEVVENVVGHDEHNNARDHDHEPRLREHERDVAENSCKVAVPYSLKGGHCVVFIQKRVASDANGSC